MPYRYTDQQREDALRRLALNNGNIRRTHLQTRIPERTLRDWRSRYPLPAVNLPDDQTTHQSIAYTPDDELDLAETRSRILNAVDRLSRQLDSDHFDYAHVLALSRLLKHVVELNDILCLPHTRTEITRLVFVDPDGSEHSRPQWERDRDEPNSPDVPLKL